MEIEKGEMRVTRCCRSMFIIHNKSSGKDRCPCGKEDPEMFTPWFDESGDRMFELVSDVSGR